MSLQTESIDAGWREANEAAPTGRCKARAGSPDRFAARLHAGIDTISSAWRRFEAEGGATAYQTVGWVTCICDHLVVPAGVTPLFVEIRAAATNEIVLILPLAATRRFGFAILGWLDLGVCDYAMPVMAPGLALSAEEAEQVWAAVLAALPRTDLIDIRQVPARVAGVANPLAMLRAGRPMALQAFGLTLAGDPETLLPRVMGRKGCRRLATYENRLADRGPVHFIEAATPADLSEIYAVMIEQRRRRFQKLGRFELLSRPEVAAFYRDAASRSLGGRGPARLFGLKVGDQWVATAYMLVHAGAMHGIILSIAGPEWHDCRPGMILASRLMQWSARQGHNYFDMTVGNLPYKSDLGAEAHALYRILEPRSVAGRLAVRVIVGASSLRAWVQRRPKLFRSIRSIRQGIRRLADRFKP